jgi:hypothetical protein
MKPKNFPGRKNLRRVSAGLDVPGFRRSHYIADIRFRVGAKGRNGQGALLEASAREQ